MLPPSPMHLSALWQGEEEKNYKKHRGGTLAKEPEAEMKQPENDEIFTRVEDAEGKKQKAYHNPGLQERISKYVLLRA